MRVPLANGTQQDGEGLGEDSSSTASPSEVKSNLFARIVSGSLGSIITSLVVTPLDVVKVRVQASTVESVSSVSKTTISSAGIPPQGVVPCPRGCGTFVLFNGQMDCLLPKSAVSFFDPSSGKLTKQAKATADLGILQMIRRIFLTEGFAGIYAGLTPTLVMAVPNTVLYFSAYDELIWRIRRFQETRSGQQRWWSPLVAGGSARLVASSVTAPFEYLRTRQASRVGKNQPPMSMVSEFRSIINTEGVGTLYKGLRPTLWRDVPFSSIYWFVLESMKEQQNRQRHGRTPSATEQAGYSFLNGFVAGLVSAAFTTPFDVVKTRQQAELAVVVRSTNPVVETCCHGGATVYEAPQRSTGMLAHITHIVETEGVAGLWRGNQARMLKVAPACGIMIATYEFGKLVLQ